MSGCDEATWIPLGKRIADALGLEESETHRRVWNRLVWNAINAPAVAPESWGVFVNFAPDLQLNIRFDLGDCRVERIGYCRLSTEKSRAHLRRVNDATDGLIAFGFANAGDTAALAWLTGEQPVLWWESYASGGTR